MNSDSQISPESERREWHPVRAERQFQHPRQQRLPEDYRRSPVYWRACKFIYSLTLVVTMRSSLVFSPVKLSIAIALAQRMH